jgi:hypothetical protein
MVENEESNAAVERHEGERPSEVVVDDTAILVGKRPKTEYICYGFITIIARHSSECLTTGNMEFPRRTITSHYVVPLLAHIPHVAKHATTSDTSSIACISKRETMRVKDSHYFVYQLDSNT